MGRQRHTKSITCFTPIPYAGLGGKSSMHPYFPRTITETPGSCAVGLALGGRWPDRQTIVKRRAPTAADTRGIRRVPDLAFPFSPSWGHFVPILKPIVMPAER
ncbi:hypothetical protein CEXT_369791 [Caerostris extrusa]|uniref:Uncharacterized protein n=1 Tax=Caerostris extrusa TaxID=172846 RepID=A0AAV4UP94_CAEEX|nr:hypothetical protein CEXT_369791 [Caerostris extrusa]